MVNKPVPHSGIQGSGSPQLLAEGNWAGVQFFSAKQHIEAGTVWKIQRPDDTVVMHLSGPITELETELDGAGSVCDPPMPGEVWVIPATVRYQSRARGGLVHYAELHLSRSVVNSITEKPLLNEPLRARAGCYYGFLHSGLRRLERLVRAADDLSRLAAASLSHSLMLDFYSRYNEGSAPRAVSRHVRLSPAEQSRIVQYIDDKLDSPLRLEALAELVQMTPHELLVAFRAAFGTTPAQYIIGQRLRRARWLLVNSSKGLATIAFETGFSSHAHFTATFLARLEVTPNEFRRDQHRSLEPGHRP